MLLAIDIGNTSTACGVWDGTVWLGTWRGDTGDFVSEDELVEWLGSMFDANGLAPNLGGAICASVVPAVDEVWERAMLRWAGVQLRFLRLGADVGLNMDVEVPSSVGADRLANCLGALAKYQPPIIVVDFGTATTFEAIDQSGSFVGGAILAGVRTASQALFDRAAKLSDTPLVVPDHAIGRNTTESLQSGIMFSYAGGVDALAEKMKAELGGNSKVIATGGLSSLFMGLCQALQIQEPMLTLDGLVVAFNSMR